MRGRRSLYPILVQLDNRSQQPNLINQNQDLDQTPVNEMAENMKLIKDHFIPSTYVPISANRAPEVQAAHYEIKHHMIQMLPTFYGKLNEDPYKHLDEFLEVCTTVKIQNMSDDALKMRLFPFSLKDKAKNWISSLEKEMNTWPEMQQEFLKKFYPIGRTNQMRRAITHFKQNPGELFHDAWERFNELLRKCPHHGIPKWQQVEAFYEGLDETQRQNVDASCGGSFMNKTEKEAWDLFDLLCENSLHRTNSSSFERNAPTLLQRKNAAYAIGNNNPEDLVDKIAEKLDKLWSKKQNPSNSEPQYANQAPFTYHEICAICSDPSHHVSECPSSLNQPQYHPENVNAIQAPYKSGNDPFANTYNPGWRNHPNFSWKPNHDQKQSQVPPYRPPHLNQGNSYQRGQSQFQGNQNQQFQGNHNQHQAPILPQPPHPQPNSSTDDKLMQYFQQQQLLLQQQNQNFQQQQQQFFNLISQQMATANQQTMTQLGQIAESIMRREPGCLPSQPTTNPGNQPSSSNGSNFRNKNFEQSQAVTVLRSGKVIGDPDKSRTGDENQASTDASLDSQPNPSTRDKVEQEEESIKDKRKKRFEEDPEQYKPKAPFPTALEPKSNALRKTKKDDKMREMMKIFEKVQINIPLLQAIEHIPDCAKFLKDMCTNKRRYNEIHKPLDPSEDKELTEQSSAIILNQLPLKRKDPGAPLISCVVGDTRFDRSLLDLGSSVNLLPTSVYEKYDIGELKQATISLQFADRSTKMARGVIEDVLVKVGNFCYPVDFIVLDMDAPVHPSQVPVILGRPFLSTIGAIINCRSGEMSISFGDMNLIVNIFKQSHHNEEIESDDDECYSAEMVDVMDTIVKENIPTILSIESLTEEEGDQEVSSLTSSTLPNLPPWTLKREPLPAPTTPMLPSIHSPPSLELKPLPSSLKYVFLGEGDTLPVIIASDLSPNQESKLVDLLKEHKSVIGWTVADLKGISPTVCMHQIHLEENAKPSCEMQRRLNPTMREVVKKEVIKWLDAGIIYPISDSKWVSPTHVVPKKSGLTIIENDKGELLPTRTTTSWRVCIDYRKLNAVTKKDHFPLPFIDQILEKLAGQKYFCFLDGYSGYNQVAIYPPDQEKTTFTCPYGTFAFRRMPFGLCNAPATFQRCMLSIFSDMVGEFLEVFMDDFSVFGSSFDDCLLKLEKVLKRCEETNLTLSWEKSHFMVQEGIVLGHVVSAKGMEVDKAKIEVIQKLPTPSSLFFPPPKTQI